MLDTATGASTGHRLDEHFALCSTFKLPLVADVTKTISTLYGALFTQGPNAGVAMRATFIIDGKGAIVYKHVGPLSEDAIAAKVIPAIEKAKSAAVASQPAAP